MRVLTESWLPSLARRRTGGSGVGSAACDVPMYIGGVTDNKMTH